MIAAEGFASLVAPDGPDTRVWLYNGSIPGPVLRARQGQSLSIDFENRLSEPTTVHWHGLRVPFGQDGVPYLSQPPVEPGDQFRYELPLLDAGTFWYHPHFNSSEQLGRGLHGILVVEEPAAIAGRLGADRDIVWVLDDWRLDKGAQISSFGDRHDMSHGGRIGNVFTLNGSYLSEAPLRSGERVRLRLCNVANARHFRLHFGQLNPWVVALDGHPVRPRRLADSGLWLGSGQRADLVLDVTLQPGRSATVRDDAYGAERAFDAITLKVSDEGPLGRSQSDPPEMLERNPLTAPDLAASTRHVLELDGGAMGRMSEAMLNGKRIGMRDLVAAGKFWSLNGRAAADMKNLKPLFSMRQSRTNTIVMRNRTRWPHPMHLHGHSFILRDPRYFGGDELVTRDTVLLAPGEQVEVHLVANNPGTWMVHCHILEHQASGMMGVVEVV